MTPATHDITIRRGDTFRLFFRLRYKNPDGTLGDYADLTLWGSGLAQVRASADGALITTMTVTKSNQVTYTGGILLTIPDDVTALLDFTTAVWDFEITNDLGETDTYLEGSAKFTKDVSHP